MRRFKTYVTQSAANRHHIRESERTQQQRAFVRAPGPTRDSRCRTRNSGFMRFTAAVAVTALPRLRFASSSRNRN